MLCRTEKALQLLWLTELVTAAKGGSTSSEDIVLALMGGTLTGNR